MNPYRLAGHEYEKACVFQLRLNATSSSIRIRLGGKDESGQEMQPTGNSKDVVIQAFTLRKITNLYISKFKIDTVPPTATLYYDENMYESCPLHSSDTCGSSTDRFELNVQFDEAVSQDNLEFVVRGVRALMFEFSSQSSIVSSVDI
jgi:hypothetical protein